MPGANAKALDKAKTLDADVLIFDLEDSVAPEAKAEAREAVAAALGAGGYGEREILVRVNALSSPWGRDDLAAALAAKPHGVLVPKIQSAADVAEADAAIRASEAALWIMIETPRAILNIAGIAGAAETTRLAGMIMGLNDLAKETRARLWPERIAFHGALTLAINAARAHGLVAVDGVFNDIGDSHGFINECKQGLAFGFDGKTLIHPTQIAEANAVFAPTAHEVEHARAIIAAFALPESAGKGVIKVDGKMTELLHLEEARRVVALADAIARKGAA